MQPASSLTSPMESPASEFTPAQLAALESAVIELVPGVTTTNPTGAAGLVGDSETMNPEAEAAATEAAPVQGASEPHTRAVTARAKIVRSPDLLGIEASQARRYYSACRRYFTTGAPQRLKNRFGTTLWTKAEAEGLVKPCGDSLSPLDSLAASSSLTAGRVSHRIAPLGSDSNSKFYVIVSGPKAERSKPDRAVGLAAF